MAQTGMSCAFPGSVASVQRQAAGLRTPARWATITIKGQHTGSKHGNETSTWHVRGPLLIAYRTQQLGHYSMSVLRRFCCKSRHTDGAGRLMPFVEAVRC